MKCGTTCDWMDARENITLTNRDQSQNALFETVFAFFFFIDC